MEVEFIMIGFGIGMRLNETCNTSLHGSATEARDNILQ